MEHNGKIETSWRVTERAEEEGRENLSDCLQ